MSRLVPCLSLLFLALGRAASAQQAPSAQDVQQAPLDEVVVTGSRISISGYQQPTPVTILGADKLQQDNYHDLQSALAKLPSVGPGSSPNSSNGSQSISAGTAGLSFINLRSLGVNRTLVLFNGQRVVPSNQSGGVDLNLVPAGLVERIDIVTGGASAAWGSDAVAGVVNIITNKKFSGVEANIEGQFNQARTSQQRKAELSFGTDVFEGRGHLILSGSYLDSPDVVLPQDTSWYRAQNLVNNPNYTATNGQPRLIHAENVGLSSATAGGLVASGPLRGLAFGPNGVPTNFNFGNVSGTLSNGGTFENPVYSGQANNLTTAIRSSTLYGRFSFSLTDDIDSYVEVNYGDSTTRNGSTSYTRQGNLTINIDNPFLPASVVSSMQQLGITSFPLGTTNINNLLVNSGDRAIDPAGLGNLNNRVERTMMREVAGLTGSLSLLGQWKWNLDLQHSRVTRKTQILVDPVIANYNLAVDPVRVTTANVGTSNLPIGSIVCRSTLTAPTNGCAPLNVLGIGVASPAAIAYVNGGDPRSELELDQQTVSVSIQGEPFSTWAGSAAVAMGLEYRDESAKQTADQLSYDRAYAAGNFQYFNASNHVSEGFLEVGLPLLKDQGVESVDLNAAGRITDYSGSGVVNTWKVGLTTQVNGDVRLRGTVSRDIRAPNLADLFDPGSSSLQVISDPFRPGNPTTNFYSVVRGNPALEPEVAKTYSAGIVLTPRWVPGLSASVDWYSIDISGAIVSPSFTYSLDQCRSGNQLYCPLIIRDAGGVITSILQIPVNAASNKTSGVDFQTDYSQPLFGGTLSMSLLGNYTSKLVINSLGRVVDMAGSLNNAPPNIQSQGFPKFRATLTAAYQKDRASAAIQVREIGAAKLNNAWGPLDVDDNDVPSVTYLDLRASYHLDQMGDIQLYAAVDNVLDKDPPIIPNGPQAPLAYFYVPTRTDIYDSLGRIWRFGVRAKF